MSNITTKDGLLWRDGVAIMLPEADQVAAFHGYANAERMVKALLLPSLPLVDGAYIIDNSTLEKLRCPRLFEYSSIRKRELVANRAGRNFGSTLHVGLATRYEIAGTDAVKPEQVDPINRSMAEWLEKNPQPVSDFRSAHHANIVMAAYNEIYGNEPYRILCTNDGKPIIEKPFLLPFGMVNNTPCYYSGKIDLATQDNNGTWAGPDHKTAFQFGESFDKQMQRDGGQMGYVWALKKILGYKPTGYIIDAIRIRKPTRKGEFEGTPPVDATDFRRVPFIVSEEDLDTWEFNTKALIQTIFFHAANNFFPEHRWNCVTKYGPCDFYDVCSCPASQRESILYSGLFEESTWSPLNPVRE